jgi:Flp pilus assembly protein TadD
LDRYTEAVPALKRAISLDSTLAMPRKHLGTAFYKTNHPIEAKQNFLKALELNPNFATAMIGMAYILLSEENTAEAIRYVELAIGKGSTFERLQSDEDLAPLRSTPEWTDLMKKYFPDKVKD